MTVSSSSFCFPVSEVAHVGGGQPYQLPHLAIPSLVRLLSTLRFGFVVLNCAPKLRDLFLKLILLHEQCVEFLDLPPEIFGLDIQPLKRRSQLRDGLRLLAVDVWNCFSGGEGVR